MNLWYFKVPNIELQSLLIYKSPPFWILTGWLKKRMPLRTWPETAHLLLWIFLLWDDELVGEIGAIHSFWLHRPLSGVCNLLFYGYILQWQKKIPLFLKSNTTAMEKKGGLLIKSIRQIWGKSFRKANTGNFQWTQLWAKLTIVKIVPLLLAGWIPKACKHTV